jgi:hypothetical protein
MGTVQLKTVEYAEFVWRHFGLPFGTRLLWDASRRAATPRKRIVETPIIGDCIASIQVVEPLDGVIQAMVIKRLHIAAAAILGLGLTVIGSAAGQTPSVARGAQSTAPRREAAHLPPAAATMYHYLKLRKPGELNWQRIPWLLDLPEAIKVAKAEDRPILLWVAGDDPMERC